MLEIGHIAHTYMRHVCGRNDVRTRAAYAELTRAILSDTGAIRLAYGTAGWARSDAADPYPDAASMAHAATLARSGVAPFLVSDVEHNGAFLGDNAANLAFRAHHDAVHELYGSPAFAFAGEAHTCLHTVRRLRIGRLARAVLTWEIIGQSAFYVQHGRFPLVNGRQPIPSLTDASVSDADRILASVARDIS